MSTLSKAIGQRIRNYRALRGLSQESLAELSGCHPSYIGQIERGEKNATLESISKISGALGISLSRLFEGLDSSVNTDVNFPLACYEKIASHPVPEQKRLLKILEEIEKYASIK